MNTHNRLSISKLAREVQKLITGAIVTGGAGFIGSHLVDSLMATGISVTVIDNLTTGSVSNLHGWEGNRRLKFIKADVRDLRSLSGIKTRGTVLLHLAADPEVRAAESEPEPYVESHLRMTSNALELCRKHDIPTILFTSSSTVYGDAETLPTPETYEPLSPISVYGRMKLECERMIIETCEREGLRGLILRYANIVGPRSGHGVIRDFTRKLLSSSQELEILGDGTQKKSYLYISDCVDASLLALQTHLTSSQKSATFNIGNSDWIDVSTIARLVCKTMGLTNVRFRYKPASSDGRGWKGDVKEMLLDISRLREGGWEPKYSSREAVRLAARAYASQLGAASPKR